MPRVFRQRKMSSSSSSEDESNKKTDESPETVNIKDKIEEIKYLQKLRDRNHGLDVYSLAIGENEATSSSQSVIKQIENDPWKSRSGGLVDMKVILEKRGNEIVKNMHSTFAKETNQRDEDAEMQKFIEEQLRKKKEADKSNQTESNKSTSSANTYKAPEDVLFDVPKYLLENTSRHKSEEILSEQMLSGIPEVDLGIEEKIRNIEETERARQQITTSSVKTTLTTTRKNESSSVNFVQHKRFDESVINADKNRLAQQKDSKPMKPEPVVGDAPKHELLQPHKRKDTEPHNKSKKHDSSSSKKTKGESAEKASDDYCLEKFKKNMKFNRGNKIKIA